MTIQLQGRSIRFVGNSLEAERFRAMWRSLVLGRHSCDRAVSFDLFFQTHEGSTYLALRSFVETNMRKPPPQIAPPPPQSIPNHSQPMRHMRHVTFSHRIVLFLRVGARCFSWLSWVFSPPHAIPATPATPEPIRFLRCWVGLVGPHCRPR